MTLVFARKVQALLYRNFWWLIVAGLATVGMGQKVFTGPVASIFICAGLLLVLIGGWAMIADRARRMAKHEREQERISP